VPLKIYATEEGALVLDLIEQEQANPDGRIPYFHRRGPNIFCPALLRHYCCPSQLSTVAMDLDDAQRLLATTSKAVATAFQRVPGSAVIIRYVQSSYQNDPIRSAIELVLVLFFIRYLLSPSYSTQKQNFVQLNEDVWRPPRCAVYCFVLD
jgi:hypothetical protein